MSLLRLGAAGVALLIPALATPVAARAGELDCVVPVDADWTTRGDPDVPVRLAWVLLPPRAERNVSVEAAAEGVRSASAGSGAGWSGGSGAARATAWPVGADGLAPARWAQLLSVQNCHGWRYAAVRVFGGRFDADGRGVRAGSVRLRLSWTDGVESTATGPLPRLPFLNAEDVAPLYKEVRAAGAADILVIAPQQIIQSGAFDTWGAHRWSQGYVIDFTAVEDVATTYTGAELADKIRACIKDRWQNDGVWCVLLVGDPDPDDNSLSSDPVGSVPMKMCWPRNYARSESLDRRQAPTDYYYADLTGNWDRDGDGYYGEGYVSSGEPGDMGSGGMDLVAEVMVGRIPFDDATEVETYLNRVVNYELAVVGYDWDAGGTQAWRSRGLLAGLRLDGFTPGYHYGEWLKNHYFEPRGWTCTRAYTGDFGVAPEIAPCTEDDFISAWQGGAGVVSWTTHGEAGYATDVLSTSNVWRLPAMPALVVATCCKNGLPESASLASELLSDHALAVFACTRVFWYIPGWEGMQDGGGLSYGCAIVEGLVEGGMAGDVLRQTATWYLTNSGASEYDVHNVQEMTLFGDPLARLMRLDVAPPKLGSGREGKHYNVRLRMAGGYYPATFTVTAGSMPPGLRLETDGLITGKPRAAGTWEFRVRTEDVTGATASRIYSIRIRSEKKVFGCFGGLADADPAALLPLLALALIAVWLGRRRRCSSTAPTTT